MITKMDAAYYQSLYHRALDATGNAAYAQEAVSVAQAALKDIYNQAMVRTGGDNVQAAAFERRLAEPVARLAQLIPQVRNGDDVEARGAALRQLMSAMEDIGYDGGRPGLHTWLRANVQDDGVLRAAGFDPVAVRRLPRPEGWPDDLEALLSIVREQLELVQSLAPGRVTDAEIEAQMDVVRASAHRFGYEVPATAPPVEPQEPAEGALTLADLDIPRRV